jgi:DNA-binding CsgD family transcriptional regulator
MSETAGLRPAARARLTYGAAEIAERRRLAPELYARLGSCKTVAQELGCSEETVRDDLERAGVRRRLAAGAPENRVRSMERREQAVKLYVDERLNMLAVADRLGISERQVSRYLHKARVPIRPSGQPPKYPPVLPALCANPTCPRAGEPFLPGEPVYRARPASVAAGRHLYCSRSCSGSHQWRLGRFSTALIRPFWSGEKRRRYKGWLTARNPPKRLARTRGGQRRDVPLEKVAEVLHLKGLKYGRGSIALRTGLPEKVVRRILDEHRPDDTQLTVL